MDTTIPEYARLRSAVTERLEMLVTGIGRDVGKLHPLAAVGMLEDRVFDQGPGGQGQTPVGRDIGIIAAVPVHGQNAKLPRRGQPCIDQPHELTLDTGALLSEMASTQSCL